MSSRARTLRALAAAAILLVAFAPALGANPFMGAGTAEDGTGREQISPVRAGASNPELVARQASLRESLAVFLRDWKRGGSRDALWGILGAAFAYGVLHAFGPGHRKTVVFSLYIARKAPVWEPAATGLLLALLHAGAAVVILFALRGVSGAISGKADRAAVYLEGTAYVILIATALALVVRAVVDFAKDLRCGESGSDEHGDNAPLALGTLLLTGVYPCPGAILILILSLSLDIAGIGALAVLAMSLGMSVPILAAGYLAWFGRKGLFSALKRRETLVARVSSVIELAGYSFLLAFALYMAQPFLASLVRAALSR